MQIIIDLDGTICTEEKMFSRSLAKPIKKSIESVNSLFKAGHTIIIYSARNWIEYEMTLNWLLIHKVKFHQLIMGKPQGDVWIDDRAIAFDNWENTLSILEKKLNK
jgi:hypothetical protein